MMYLEDRIKRIEDLLIEIKSMLPTQRQTKSGNEHITYTIKSLAKELGWSRGKLEQELRKGTFRTHKCDGRIILLREEVIEDIKKLPSMTLMCHAIH